MEHQNQMLDQYLRNYINYQQDSWLYWLAMAEYAYNKQKQDPGGTELCPKPHDHAGKT